MRSWGVNGNREATNSWKEKFRNTDKLAQSQRRWENGKLFVHVCNISIRARVGSCVNDYSNFFPTRVRLFHRVVRASRLSALECWRHSGIPSIFHIEPMMARILYWHFYACFICPREKTANTRFRGSGLIFAQAKTEKIDTSDNFVQYSLF